ncbi:alpha/beta hydrolase [Tumebacillus lipolyticus]|uniref:Alpha/beta hydrolase n=1 Tax=Tumebacillus lipolyticus TaxID=1280370 RepID=A0ABW4ZV42_9BACL
MKRKRRVWIWLSFLMVMLFVLLPCASVGYIGWSYLHPEKKRVEGSPKAFYLDYQDVSFSSQEQDITLKGWLIPAAEQQERIVIFAHGYSENRASANVALHMANVLHRRDIASLMFDFRGAGESDGTMTSLGYYEKQDLIGAIEYVKSLGYQQIGLVGFSMGAATALDVAPEVPEVKAVIADSAFTDLSEYLAGNLPKLHPIADIGFMPQLALWETSLLTGIEPQTVQPIESIQNVRDRGVFLIHAAGDDIIPAEESRQLAEASGSRNTVLWISPAEQHVGTYLKETNEYLVRTTAFLSYYLGVDRADLQSAQEEQIDEVVTRATLASRLQQGAGEL